MKELNVDIEVHRNLGMTIMSKEEVDRRKKICKQCKRLLPIHYFPSKEDIENCSEVEGYCGLCWSCP